MPVIVLGVCLLTGVPAAGVVAAQEHATLAAVAESSGEDRFPMHLPSTVGAADPAGQPEGLHDAVAAALLAVVWDELGESGGGDVALETLQVARGERGEWLLDGAAVALPGDGSGRIGLHFATVFDPVARTLARPRLTIGGVAAGERVLPNDPDVIRRLEDAWLDRVAGDFGETGARLQLDSIQTVQAGPHLLRLAAEGLADFGPAGTSRARIEALFDLRSNHWRHLDYSLDAGGGWQPLAREAASIATPTAAVGP